MSDFAIDIQHLYKRFLRADEPGQKSERFVERSWFWSLVRRRRSHFFWAIQDVSMQIRVGEAVALIGANGCGKSSMLRLISGITTPTSGSLSLSGTVIPILNLGVGYQGEFTGLENLELGAALYNISPAQVNERLDEIVEFAGIGAFLNTPYKHYSAGMCVRLGFAVAIVCDAPIYVIDEVLAVGDQSFQAACIHKLLQMKQAGKTIVFVSHEMDLVAQLCDRAIVFDEGKIIGDGNPLLEPVLLVKAI